MGEVTGVDKEKKLVFPNSPDRERVPLPYDYLILATGANHSYFGHNEFEKYEPGLKRLADAVAMRNRILQAFEQAEAEEDTSVHQDLLTFALVGAGPAGVEMAGAIAGLVRNSLRTQFRRIDPTSARIVLVDRSNKVLGPLADDLSKAAKERLEKLGRSGDERPYTGRNRTDMAVPAQLITRISRKKVCGSFLGGTMLLAGDIGGTKTDLAVYSSETGPHAPLAETEVHSADYGSLEAIAKEFLTKVKIFKALSFMKTKNLIYC